MAVINDNIMLLNVPMIVLLLICVWSCFYPWWNC